MKGMSHTLVIVVSAIVILVAALVIITIFGSGVQQVASLAQAEAICRASAESSCKSANTMPPTWYAPTVKYNDKLIACGNIESLKKCRCENFKLVCKTGEG